MSLYDNLKDKEIVYKISHEFYERIYKHPWMKLYFTGVDQKFITEQQTYFILQSIGGPKNYKGRLPSNAHTHMLITNELFELREMLLIEAFEAVNAPQDLRDQWLKIDNAFRKVIIQDDPKKLAKRYAFDEFLIFENPQKKKAA